MAQRTDQPNLKAIVKAAVVEVFEQTQDLVREALAEAIEDLGMVEAIKEGSRSAPIERDGVFRILRKRR